MAEGLPLTLIVGDDAFVVTEPKLASNGRRRVIRVTVADATSNHIRTSNAHTYLRRTGLQVGAPHGGGRIPVLHSANEPELLAIEAADQYRSALDRLAKAAATLAEAQDPLANDDAATVALLASRAEERKTHLLDLRASTRTAA